MFVRSRAPLRLGLAGGGTDVSPYCDEYGGSVLNVTIDRYAYAFIKPLPEPIVRFRATDLMLQWEGPLQSQIPLDGTLRLHKAVYNYIINNYHGNVPLGLEVSTFCDAPAGSGLGSSSTLVVAMMKAFVEYLNLPMDDYSIAQNAFFVERVDCGLQGGRQDQYSATFGGFNFMEFYSGNKAIVNPLRIKNWISCELEASLILLFTGVSRESAGIIEVQSAKLRGGVASDAEPFHAIKREAIMMKESLLRGDFDGIVESLQMGWDNKKKLAASVSNERINQIYESALRAGALAGKVSGAGGGGFMMFYVSPELRMNVIRALEIYGGQVGNAHFTSKGAQAWKLF